MGGGELLGLSGSYTIPACYHPILLDNNNPFRTSDMLFFPVNLLATVSCLVFAFLIQCFSVYVKTRCTKKSLFSHFDIARKKN